MLLIAVKHVTWILNIPEVYIIITVLLNVMKCRYYQNINANCAVISYLQSCVLIDMLTHISIMFVHMLPKINATNVINIFCLGGVLKLMLFICMSNISKSLRVFEFFYVFFIFCNRLRIIGCLFKTHVVISFFQKSTAKPSTIGS